MDAVNCLLLLMWTSVYTQTLAESWLMGTRAGPQDVSQYPGWLSCSDLRRGWRYERLGATCHSSLCCHARFGAQLLPPFGHLISCSMAWQAARNSSLLLALGRSRSGRTLVKRRSGHRQSNSHLAWYEALSTPSIACFKPRPLITRSAMDACGDPLCPLVICAHGD